MSVVLKAICATLLCGLLALTWPCYTRFKATKKNGLHTLPGTWHSTFCSIGVTLSIARLQKCAYIDGLFEAYGDVVRIGPSQVVFRDENAIKTVYGLAGKFPKSGWYKSIQTNGGDHAMTILPHTQHAIRRKTFASFYAIANLSKFEHQIKLFIDEMAQKLDVFEGKCSVDILHALRHLMVDITGSLFMNTTTGSVSKWAQGVVDPLTKAISDFPKKGVLSGMVPGIVWKVLSTLPIVRWREFVGSDRLLSEFVSAKVYAALDQISKQSSSGELFHLERPACLLEQLLNHRDILNADEMTSEILGHLIAGVETTSTTLTYILYTIATPTNSEKCNYLQQQLRQELLSLPTEGGDKSQFDSPFLDACIKEGLRLFGAGPSVLERVVSPGKEFTIQGFLIPEGTIVGAQAWSLHRKEGIFPDSGAFMPERWLGNESLYFRNRMLKHFTPFGHGTRICAGQSMAILILKLVLSTLVQVFEIKVDQQETNDKSMAIRDSFVQRLCGFAMLLILMRKIGHFPKEYGVQAYFHA